MFGVVICCHGELASGFKSAVELILGNYENVCYYDFKEGRTTKDVDKFYKESFDKFKIFDNILVLTDLVGGSPFNRAVNLSINNEKIKVIAGINLSICINAIMNSEDLSIDFQDFVQSLINEAKESIESFEFKRKIKNDFQEEGI